MTTLPQPGGEFKKVPAGNWPARCCALIDYGHQESFYKGETGPDKHMVYLRWELHDEETVMDDGRPMIIGRSFTWSSSPKSNLRKLLEAWRGQPFTQQDYGTFDIRKLLGAPCLVGVTDYTNKDGEERAGVNTVVKVPKTMRAVPPLVNEPVCFWLTPELYDHELYESFPDWLKEKIAKSPEWKELNGNASAKTTQKKELVEDDLPF